MEINEKKLKNILKEQTQEFQKHTDAVLEEHKKDTDAKIETTLKQQREEFKKDINVTLEQERKEFQIHIGALAEDFTDQIKLLAEAIQGIEEKKVGKEEFEVLENRVGFLEANPV